MRFIDSPLNRLNLNGEFPAYQWLSMAPRVECRDFRPSGRCCALGRVAAQYLSTSTMASANSSGELLGTLWPTPSTILCAYFPVNIWIGRAVFGGTVEIAADGDCWDRKSRFGGKFGVGVGLGGSP